MKRHSRESGFTLMEILIAMTVLMIGLLPMLAVFKTALNNLNRAIEDTYSASIAQSVFDAIRLGLKDMKVEHDPGTPSEWKFFILDHDGVKDLEDDRGGNLLKDFSSAANRSQLLTRDYVIVLPSRASEGAGTEVSKAFLYPRRNANDNASRKPVEYVTSQITGADGKTHESKKVKVEAVYALGKKLKEKKDEDGKDKDAARLKVEENDPYGQYSFAFTIRKSKAPNPAAPTSNARTQELLDGLYEVVVRVYRNFNPDPKSKRNETVGGPGREYITHVAE
jgi:hypothetical protein